MSTDNFLPDEATLAALGNLPDDEPVIMLNLLEFPTWQKANEDRQRGLDLTWAFPTRTLR